ncbi:MAG: PEGA domain-containing protein [Pseudomonadales bacterium]|nr:PEGA domain-containing protein [Pseudomonadales bacterium]
MRRCFVAILLIALTGCATVKRGPTETFEVRSAPMGASVTSTSGWECTTPCSVRVARRGDFVVTVRKDGYVTETFTIKSVPVQDEKKGLKDRVVLADTEYIGRAADWASGANREHRPNPLEVDLEPE